MEVREQQAIRTTLQVPVRARWVIDIDCEEEIGEAIAFARSRNVPWLVLGEGSNVLFRGTGVLPVAILHLRMQTIRVLADGARPLVQVAAGYRWHQFVEWTVAAGWWGIENLALIPGNVGAAPVQNIGAYGVELQDVLQSVRAYDTVAGQIVELSPEDCHFGYRSSVFKQHPDRWIITEITVQLSRSPKPQLHYPDLAALRERPSLTSREVMETIIRIRRRKLPDPQQLPNAGSFFKNPVLPRSRWEQLRQEFPLMPGYPLPSGQVKIPAAWLIESCGWKGKRIGNAGISPNHAAIVVNYGVASGDEIVSLVERIQDSVQRTFGISLEPEVRIL